MKKKIENLAKEIGCGNEGNVGFVKKIDDSWYFVSGYRILKTAEKPNGIEENKEAKKNSNSIKKHMDVIYTDDYHAYDLPTVEEIKGKKNELVGRKRTTVVWCPDGETQPAMNIKYLLAGMDALHATKMYTCGRTKGIFLFENDNLNAKNVYMFLPIMNHGTTGYWTVEYV